ncbi:uncharacterized protein SPPG_05527 [Spizellomyces punctatus DAOM BR117]|uniref:Uncharacterized protein n=1 Tax=Spizellomyces punctatus (strain DAOM BR117) TaxID=645134 RepID=A0A0L0HDS4_SPIPD|nr:uncharacterized protein SPPG_05527 [Spizellomyces punctatus DAOM BR117]KNC99272.1 hypothetical protein SPPG_05527 [Spizellomyces punctatus DAOM BR117]|eukprot:XP_016607312.1 hypothetical protein SPPG_05527 [Spizellomyces punctatus DAOM BR117]
MSWIPISSKSVFENHILDASCGAEAFKAGGVGAVAGALGGSAFGWWVAMPGQQILKEAASSSLFFAAAGAAFYGTKCTVAQIRHRDDMWNAPAGALVAGVMLGLRSGKMSRVVAHGALLPVVVAFTEWAAFTSSETKDLSYEQKQQKRDEGFFQWPKRDPFAERWAEIKKREEEKGAPSA